MTLSIIILSKKTLSIKDFKHKCYSAQQLSVSSAIMLSVVMILLSVIMIMLSVVIYIYAEAVFLVMCHPSMNEL
jgi:hypothetical protein